MINLKSNMSKSISKIQVDISINVVGNEKDIWGSRQVFLNKLNARFNILEDDLFRLWQCARDQVK